MCPVRGLLYVCTSMCRPLCLRALLAAVEIETEERLKINEDPSCQNLKTVVVLGVDVFVVLWSY